jgi:hemin uptake protein HemP
MCQHQDGSLCRCKTNQLIEQITNKDLVIESNYLFDKRKIVKIRHDQEMYRLQITSNGKLILTK